MRYAVDFALDKARNGKGPTLIEAITYRLCDHTTADDASRYQPQDELKAAWKKEPINRLAQYLESQNVWSRDKEAELQTSIAKEIDQAVGDYLNTPAPEATDMFDSLYETLPESLRWQRDALGEKK